MRLRKPHSLFARIALVLLLGLLPAQILSELITVSERDRLLYKTDENYWFERIASVVKLLDSVPAAQRQSMLPALSARRLSLRLLSEEAPTSTRASRPDEEQISVRLGSQYPMRSLPSANPAVVSFEIRLRDGRWVAVDYRSPDSFGWPVDLLLSHAVLLIAAIALTFVATRFALRPLAQFTSAADKLGEDFDSPPLPETGAREVVRAAHAFNTMQARIKQYIEERIRLLTAISHDLRTPLTRLRLRAEFVREDPALREALLRDLANIEAMTTSVLDLLQGADREETFRNVDINALIETIAADANELGGHVTVTGHAGAPYRAMSLALRRCLENLVDNALKYGGCANITVNDRPETLEITISDKGPGIPENQLSQVFEPFYRLEPSRNPDTGGTGLGLAIARNITSIHGGDLTLRNQPQGGLEARMRLPRT